MIKRYDIEAEAFGGCDMCSSRMDECDTGEWVKFDTYEKLKDRAELLAENAVHVSNVLGGYDSIRTKKLRERAERVIKLIE